jgi:FixJ family two-component response regulator
MMPALDNAMNARPLIHVVDDDESLRTALLGLLRAAGHEVRGYGSTGEFLLQPPPAGRPGCLLLDLRLPGLSGLELQAALPAQGIALPVIFLTGHPDVASSVRAMKAGAVDYLEKPIERKPLFEAVRRALAMDEAQRAARDAAAALYERFAQLSPREREVFDLVVSGRLNKQIADQLGIAERTVKAQRAQLMDKLDVGSAAELGVLAERLRQLQSG